VWLDAVEKENRVRRGGDRIEMDGWTIVTLPEHHSVHCRQNWHVDFGLGHTEVSEDLDLSGSSRPAVGTHRRQDKGLCPCVPQPFPGGTDHGGEVADAAAADGDRDPHAWFDGAS
jgi:hypothetical protein